MAFEGFELTYDFGDAAAEARACRMNCALFDFSFLECARLEGDRAASFIEGFTGRSLVALRKNEIFYALRVGAAGEVVADLTIWRTGTASFDVMSGRREDIVGLLACPDPSVNVTDLTADRGTFALQGPLAIDVLRKLGDMRAIEPLRYFTFVQSHIAGIPCTVGRLGYTGEAGFEIIVRRRRAAELWQALSAQAAPAGFIAADMLRIEAGFVLFANEFRLAVAPREIGLEKFSRSNGVPKPEIRLVSFRAEADRLSWPWRPPGELQRPSMPGTIVVTSACQSIAAGGILGLGYVLAETRAETTLHDSMATFRNIRLTPKPFYDTSKQRPRAPWQ